MNGTTLLTDLLNSITADARWILPEIALSVTCLLVVVLDLIWPNRRSWLLVAIFAGVLVSWGLYPATDVLSTPLFNDWLRYDGPSVWVRWLVDGALLLVLLLHVADFQQTREWPRGEYFPLLLGAVIGVHLLALSHQFLMLYLSVELVSLCSYAAVVLSSRKESTRAALTFLLFGAFSAAIMLYGISLLYGLTGSLSFFDFGLTEQPALLAVIIGFLILCGLFFKITAFPFHPWAPDVYDSASLPLTAFLSVVPKLGAALVIWRLFAYLPVAPLQASIGWVLAVVALVSLFAGNMAALRQQTARKMMAFSSVAQSGMLIFPVLSGQALAIEALLFYMAAFALANMAVFAFIGQLEARTGSDAFTAASGWGRVDFWPALWMTVAMLSLTGLPITVGFMAKLFVFLGLWESYQLHADGAYLYLLALGMANTVIALYYYLQLPYHAFLGKNIPQWPTVRRSLDGWLLVALALLLVGLFFAPQLLSDWIRIFTR